MDDSATREEQDPSAPSTRKSEGWLAALGRVLRALGGLAGLAGGLALTFFKLEELAVENGWRISLNGWLQDFAAMWIRNVAQIESHQWPSVWVILTEGLVAAAAISIVFSYTVNNISQRISTIWQYMRPITLPTDVVRADQATREWINKLSAKESADQQLEIARLIKDCSDLKRERDGLRTENYRLGEALKKAGERLKANDRVFSQFEKISRLLQSKIDRARQKYPVSPN
ncbi:MAG: hypothetical protein JNL81_07170 [Hyphomonadaceae bacterium]|nr:hypothetical protein [Hyphomonadaceae bacterium]